MSRYEDLKGKVFGRLTVICMDEEKGTRRRHWVCECDCGNTKSIRADALKNGNTLSCGCLKKEQDNMNLTKNHSHKMSDTVLYSRWTGMKDRCYNPSNPRYQDYGGRGIEVCEEWKFDFSSFMKWAFANGYEESLQIDRVDNDGDYEPSNCKWSNSKEQSNNRRNNINIIYKDKSYTLAQLAELLNMDERILYSRYKRGDRGKDLIREKGVIISPMIGSKNVRSKINEYQAKDIKKRLESGISPIDISRNMNISKHIVYDISRGKTWNWI